MDEGKNEWVIYHPPKSVSFGHQSRIRDPKRAWPLTETFLKALTKPRLCHRADLLCIHPEGDDNADDALKRLEEARQLFGTQINSPDTLPGWMISAEQLPLAIRFALAGGEDSEQAGCSFRLHFHYRFHWNEFAATHAEFENKDSASLLGIFIEPRKLFLQPTLIIPLPWNSDRLRRFLSEIEPVLPFRLRDQYFKRSIPTKNGGVGLHGRMMNLEANWRTAS